MKTLSKKTPSTPSNTKKKTVFSYTASDATSVAVAGSFNGWKAHPMKFQKEKNIWSCTIDLPAGRYEYRFVVNGTDWINDPAAKECCPNSQGGTNCVRRVA